MIMKKKSLLLVFILFAGLMNLSAQQIIAHRGYWKTNGSAQNSIEALMQADAIKAYGSEVDIWLSSDGIPVVNHDAEITLDGKKTDCTGDSI
jgi:glycerophosphoryl diester phosphodiesterase